MKLSRKTENLIVILGIPVVVALGFAVEGEYWPAILFAMFAVSHGALLVGVWGIRNALKNGVLYGRGGGRILRTVAPVIFWLYFCVSVAAIVLIIAFAFGTDWILWLAWKDR